MAGMAISRPRTVACPVMTVAFPVMAVAWPVTAVACGPTTAEHAAARAAVVRAGPGDAARPSMAQQSHARHSGRTWAPTRAAVGSRRRPQLGLDTTHYWNANSTCTQMTPTTSTPSRRQLTLWARLGAIRHDCHCCHRYCHRRCHRR